MHIICMYYNFLKPLIPSYLILPYAHIFPLQTTPKIFSTIGQNSPVYWSKTNSTSSQNCFYVKTNTPPIIIVEPLLTLHVIFRLNTYTTYPQLRSITCQKSTSHSTKSTHFSTKSAPTLHRRHLDDLRCALITRSGGTIRCPFGKGWNCPLHQSLTS